MQGLKFRMSNRKGFTLILSVLLIVVFLGAAVMAVDVGHMRVNRADVHSAADAAALAGIEKYSDVGDAGAAQTEANLYASKFQADGQALSVASSTIGGWDSTKTYPNAFVALGTAGSVAADDVVVQHLGNYVFAPALFAHTQTHTASATSIAIGMPGKSVTQSTCVAPVVMSYSDLLKQIGVSGDPALTAADIEKLLSAGPADTVKLGIPNGSQVSSDAPGNFYQVELPPVYTAAGVSQTGQTPSASEYKNAYTCTGGNSTVGIGDWLAIINGQKANQTQQGADNANNNTYPTTIEVALTDTYSNTIPGCTGGQIKGCLQVKYLGAFTLTREPDSKGVTGYFSALSPPAGGIAGQGAAAGPLTQVKTRLVY